MGDALRAPYLDDGDVRLYLGECVEVMREMKPESVDAVVCDPPAGIAFMGRAWDTDKGGRDSWIAWLTEAMTECYRVMKPGAHALVWALPRTSHWTGMAIEGAGFEVRDRLVHLFGSGFPKSLDVSKAIDKAAGAERGPNPDFRNGPNTNPSTKSDPYMGRGAPSVMEIDVGPVTLAAAQWEGFGTALKPAAEDWWLARKPLIGTVAANVLAFGTGALNVDGCRVDSPDGLTSGGDSRGGSSPLPMNRDAGKREDRERTPEHPAGRWPANVVLDEQAAALLDEAVGETSHIPAGVFGTARSDQPTNTPAAFAMRKEGDGIFGYGDTGGPSRYFYTAKASRADRNTSGADNTHPTVKPTDLMRWLVRLVTPPGGVVLDPFAGSGSTLVAARAEGFRAIGIEREEEYAAIVSRRLSQLSLLGGI